MFRKTNELKEITKKIKVFLVFVIALFLIALTLNNFRHSCTKLVTIMEIDGKAIKTIKANSSSINVSLFSPKISLKEIETGSNYMSQNVSYKIYEGCLK